MMQEEVGRLFLFFLRWQTWVESMEFCPAFEPNPCDSRANQAKSTGTTLLSTQVCQRSFFSPEPVHPESARPPRLGTRRSPQGNGHVPARASLLKDEAYESIKQRLLNNDYPPGTFLSER